MSSQESQGVCRLKAEPKAPCLQPPVHQHRLHRPPTPCVCVYAPALLQAKLEASQSEVEAAAAREKAAVAAARAAGEREGDLLGRVEKLQANIASYKVRQKPWGSPWEALGSTLGARWEPLEKLLGAPGKPWELLGSPLGAAWEQAEEPVWRGPCARAQRIGPSLTPLWSSALQGACY